MPRLVGFHYIGIEAVEHYVIIILQESMFGSPAFKEFSEALKGGGIGFRSADFAVLPKFENDAFHETGQRILSGVPGEFIGYIVRCVLYSAAVQPADNFCQPFHICPYLLTYRQYELPALTIAGNDDRRMFFIPFRRKDAVIGEQLLRLPLMNYLVIDCTLAANCTRWAELYFYRCHNIIQG